MQDSPRYGDVVSEVNFLQGRLALIQISEDRILIDQVWLERLRNIIFRF